MLHTLMTVRDSKADSFNKPFTLRTKEEGIRGFAEVANDPNTTIGKYPEDHDLYLLGTFNEITGQLVAEDAPKHIVSAITLVRTGKED